MKKTKLMRAALLLLVLTLITSCFVGGTFAKYVTSEKGSDTARVAKWGFTATSSIELNDLFKTAYDKNVQGAVDVIAPGTTNSANFSFTYGGNADATAPEVAYTFAVSADESSCADSIKNNTNITWKLDEGAWGTWDQLLADIKNLSGATTGEKDYAAGKLPTEFGTDNKVHTVEWQWLFDANSTGATDQDATDTTMGNATDLATVKLMITVSATQID